LTAPAGARAPFRLGRVSAFDEPRGLGSVTDRAGAEYPFHCTAIADGSRTIEVGTEVAFRVAPGHLGRMEAACIAPLPR
jgi:cold shock CspA family protein